SVPPARTRATGNLGLSRGNASSTAYGDGGSGVPTIFEPVQGTRDDRPLSSSRGSPAKAAVAARNIKGNPGHRTTSEAGAFLIRWIIGPWVLLRRQRFRASGGVSPSGFEGRRSPDRGLTPPARPFFFLARVLSRSRIEPSILHARTSPRQGFRESRGRNVLHGA